MKFLTLVLLFSTLNLSANDKITDHVRNCRIKYLEAFSSIAQTTILRLAELNDDQAVVMESYDELTSTSPEAVDLEKAINAHCKNFSVLN
tara:strand:- start:439 stop:708 length:270 start_codon:yes stop_codon:yes gene_type:complete